MQQDEWARQQAAANNSDLWVAVGAVLSQFDGLLEGYNARVAAAAAAAAANTQATGSSWAGCQPQVGFGERPIPPRLSHADLLMVSAVGERTCSHGFRIRLISSRQLLCCFVAETRSLHPAQVHRSSPSGVCVQSTGDLGDLIPALEPTQRPDWHAMAAGELGAALAQRGKCSALVKVTGALAASVQAEC